MPTIVGVRNMNDLFELLNHVIAACTVQRQDHYVTSERETCAVCWHSTYIEIVCP